MTTPNFAHTSPSFPAPNDRCWTELPYHVVPEDVRLYYMISLAYHTHSLIFHVSGERRNDFMEMILHHTCTIFLMSFSYVFGVGGEEMGVGQ